MQTFVVTGQRGAGRVGADRRIVRRLGIEQILNVDVQAQVLDALRDVALYTVLVHRFMIYAPRFLPTLDFASHFVPRDQLAARPAPAGMRPCRAHGE